VGLNVGELVGLLVVGDEVVGLRVVGEMVGVIEGDKVGSRVAKGSVGLSVVGDSVGAAEGVIVVGAPVGVDVVGAWVGPIVGDWVNTPQVPSAALTSTKSRKSFRFGISNIKIEIKISLTSDSMFCSIFTGE
jgi:hypothetical protein